MAATQLETDGCLILTAIDADWDYKASKPGTWPPLPRLNSIEFHPGAASDRMIIKQGSDADATRFDSGAVESAGDSRIKYFNGARVLPYIDYGDCVLSAGHKVIIELWRDP